MTVLWRSLHYVPANIDKYVSSPRILEADAVILDLEDSVPHSLKAEARGRIAGAVAKLAGRGPDILVRINGGSVGEADLDAVILAGVAAIVVPKVHSPEDMRFIDRRIALLEEQRGLKRHAVGLLPLIESAAGLVRVNEIAASSSRIRAINLGNEDLATDLGVEPDEMALALPRRLLAIAAAAAGVMPVGLVGRAGDYGDLDSHRALAICSRRLGMRGASSIHPSQIAVLNEVFAPAEAEVKWAGRIIGAVEEADPTRGAFALDGRMIDAPVIARARNILTADEAVRQRKSQASS